MSTAIGSPQGERHQPERAAALVAAIRAHHQRLGVCPRNCVGMNERDAHAYDYEKQNAEEQGQDRAGAARLGA
ncbi:MAG: hypothetical protein M3065_19370 [Actinomycetota bacterium]|nr:hypothetical protein [Actinomycetota bacterium]